MSKFKNFIGIDVSKEYFDVVLLLENQKDKPIHNQFVNDYKGIKALVKWLKSFKATANNSLICLEHTGVYGKLILKYMSSFDYSIWLEMSLRIIKNSGIQRGKNDKIDAQRIALYALKNVEEAKLYQLPSKTLDKIRTLLTLRDKLIKNKTSLLRTSQELKKFDLDCFKISQSHQKNSLKGVEKDLQNIEKELNKLIKEDDKIENIFNLSTSVPGIGKITALNLICFTNQFTMFSNPRQLACYCGVVPFEYTSGKSIRAKPKVHFMANKKLKKQLHLCALTAITNDSEMKLYFQRKVEEGKNKMLVINNVRNKLVHRICACIRENRNYELKNVA